MTCVKILIYFSNCSFLLCFDFYAFVIVQGARHSDSHVVLISCSWPTVPLHIVRILRDRLLLSLNLLSSLGLKNT